MSPAQEVSLGIAAYLALFIAVGGIFVLAALLVGRLVRPADPHAEKLQPYECGEPPIGSSFVQFDLRFYVVALLFIIFDVEVAFFFPWATVFGKALHLAEPAMAVTTTGSDGQVVLTPNAADLYRELGLRDPVAAAARPASLRGDPGAGADPVQETGEAIKQSARALAWMTIVDIGLFFAVVLAGFAYVWTRGDLDWVRAVRHHCAEAEAVARPPRPLMSPPAASA